MKPSITSIFSFLFLLFIANSIWNLLKIFQKPECTKGEPCYHSYLNTKPKLELLLYITDNSRSGNSLLLYDLDNFNYEETFEKYTSELQIDISKTVRNNGSLFLHTVIIPSRKFKKELTLAEAVKITEATYMKNRLTQYAIPRSTTFNLLKEETKSQSVKPVTHLKSRFAIVMCTDELYIPHNAIPAEIIGHMRINNRREFLPLVHQDFMQTRLRDLVEITSESRSEKVVFKYSPTSYGKLRFLLQIDSALNQFLTLGFTLKDLDEIKGVFADTNVYLLCATVFIGSIHLLLDFLSFKNDVSFWKSHRSMAGLSTRTVLWRAFSQTVVFLYLLDEGTSLIVLIPAAIGTVIEFWKVKKVLKATISWRGMKFDENKTESEAEAVTRQYDEESMKYLSYLLYPLCICAAIYSLIYQPHKSWYSWTINSLVNGVYAFGFLFMLPQLFVNYRLKSVAALPWRAFTYRAFNTFIDDIFAFIITMPTAHRVACFRDDVVFLIYLYQRWLYPVDKNRIDDVVSEESTSSTPIEDKKSK